MNLVLQPPGSTLCGQCCVAMVAGVTLKASRKAFGISCATTTYALRRALKKLGFRADEKLTTFRKQAQLPETCILALSYAKAFGGLGHWVVYHDGLIYCPTQGIYPYEQLGAHGAKCGSYLAFTKKPAPTHD